ncbi:PEP-CTERM/exosortase system-associated acyltransferase [Halomonas getboli]|uniref:PEP-CTERM/exosortase system-associated acyltransferase n=1 Tax=Halomonas getboli TaxID=2935862 RepID=UPI001FFEE18E|nr:PEP-CTERM/exosortase system-associated acyltransferase [Halomonas getboli]MCK2184059.1 PEP-CTERM/exosortase system-associated acyltransferase [Halomonas getboli]
MSPQLFERFRETFDFRLAVDDETRRRIFRLRHDVYCEELGFEDPADPLHHLEFDAHDERAILCLIEHRDTGLAAGCMRLVLPEKSDSSGIQRLPLEDYASDSLDHPTIHPQRFAHDAVCEVSRLAISPLFRRRSTQEEIEGLLHAHQAFTPRQRETFPLIVIGLFLTTYALVGLNGLRHVFAMMEPRLPRLLSMSGFLFTPVGRLIDFHGSRSAFYIDQRQAEQEMHADLMPLYLDIKRTLAAQMSGSTSRQATDSLS